MLFYTKELNLHFQKKDGFYYFSQHNNKTILNTTSNDEILQ